MASCPICLQECVHPVALVCGHVLCDACDRKSVAEGEEGRCVVCRAPRRRALDRLFLSAIQAKGGEERVATLGADVLSELITLILASDMEGALAAWRVFVCHSAMREQGFTDLLVSQPLQCDQTPISMLQVTADTLGKLWANEQPGEPAPAALLRVSVRTPRMQWSLQSLEIIQSHGQLVESARLAGAGKQVMVALLQGNVRDRRMEKEEGEV